MAPKNLKPRRGHRDVVKWGHSGRYGMWEPLHLREALGICPWNETQNLNMFPHM